MTRKREPALSLEEQIARRLSGRPVAAPTPEKEPDSAPNNEPPGPAAAAESPGDPGKPPSRRKPKPPPEPKGLECSACGCRHLDVLYTRPAARGRNMRVRECRNCGRRMRTYEQPPG